MKLNEYEQGIVFILIAFMGLGFIYDSIFFNIAIGICFGFGLAKISSLFKIFQK